jgi:hypothetical protein
MIKRNNEEDCQDPVLMSSSTSFNFLASLAGKALGQKKIKDGCSQSDFTSYAPMHKKEMRGNR